MRTLDQLLGPYKAGSDDKRPRSKRLTDRPGSEIYFVLHHSVSRTIGAIEGEFMSNAREVCATVGAGPLVAGQDKYVFRQYAHWNTERPFTTASWIDDQAITVEAANLQLAPPWPVGQTFKSWAAEVVAAMHVELGMPIDTVHVLDHQTVYKRGWQSYATECCGADLRGDIPDILTGARKIVADAKKGTEVTAYKRFQNTDNVKLSSKFVPLKTTTGGNSTNLAAGTGGDGLYDTLLNIYLTNLFEGAQVEGKLVLKPTGKAPSDDYRFTVEGTPSGVVEVAIPTTVEIKAPMALELQLRQSQRASATDKAAAVAVVDVWGAKVKNFGVVG